MESSPNKAGGGPVSSCDSQAHEQTVLFGYAMAVAVACAIGALGRTAWDGSLPHLMQTPGLGFRAVVWSFTVLVSWIVLALPFAAVRWLAGVRGLSAAYSAMAWGVVMGLLAIPYGVEFGRLADVVGPPGTPFLANLAESAASQWPFYASSGAVGGLTYWLIEFYPSRARSLTGSRVS